jgi:hypothetical protein
VQIAAEYIRTGDLDAAKRALDQVFKKRVMMPVQI